jgi:hypothetical protein
MGENCTSSDLYKFFNDNPNMNFHLDRLLRPKDAILNICASSRGKFLANPLSLRND